MFGNSCRLGSVQILRKHLRGLYIQYFANKYSILQRRRNKENINPYRHHLEFCICNSMACNLILAGSLVFFIVPLTERAQRIPMASSDILSCTYRTLSIVLTLTQSCPTNSNKSNCRHETKTYIKKGTSLNPTGALTILHLPT